MAEEKDVFEEAFGEDPEEKEAIEKQKKKQEEKKVHEKTVHEESNDLSPEEMDQELERRVQVHRQEKKEKRKYAKRLSFSKPKVEKRVEQAEQQQAIKKMILDKARQAIQSKKKPVPKKSSTEESVEKAMEESQPVSETPSEDEFLGDDAMDAVLEESLLREEGIQEEGIHSNQSLSTMPIPKPMIQPAMVTPIGVPLNFLEDTEKDMVFIGRKKSVFKQFGNQAALFIGKVSEEGSVFHDKKVALDSLNPHVVFVCGARGSGKCLTGDTEIALDDGRLIPISELEKTNGKVLGLEHSLKIAPLHREGFFKRKVEKILKVKLRSGKRIKLTPEHPLLTVEGWRPTETLTVGSRIATPRALPAFGNGALRDCEVKVLSYLIAEGHLSNQFVLFSNTDETLKKDFIESVLQFHPNLRISEHSKPNCFRVAQKKRIVDSSNIVRNKAGQFTSNGFVVHKRSPLAEWLSSLDIYGKLSAGKFVPNSVLQLKKEQISLFLNRLFSCDGSIYRVHNRKKNWCIDYSSSSEKLIRQVQSLLLRFGILSRLREKTIKTNNKKFKVFELVVYGENVLRFITEIGFFGAKEKKQETAFEEMSGLSRNPNTDTIPREVWKEFPVSNWAEAGRKIGYASPKSLHNTVEYAPSREKLLRLAQIEENHGIQLLAQADIFWDEITEIKELTGEFEVFDISVPTHHNFVANDIIVHNSYVLGVIAEELALKNPNVGTIVVDPIGVFWSMRLPNREEKEVALLGKYDLMPQGVNNLKVFIPNGIATQVPKSTFDATFSLQPSLLTVEDWCLTFGMDRFSPTGLLLEKSLVKVKGGYENIEGKKVGGKQNRFSMEDLIWCLETDSELNSRDKGYKQDSIRALVSRFEAAKGWGIFDDKGTPLSQLSKEGQLTILDTSFLEDNVTSLVIGLLARRILAARKLSTRKEAAKRLKTQELDELLELEIPPTWLFIDEAHTLIPSGNVKTPATNALVEYVKQGRRPGCSLVFATQQPSAIDTKVLSQLDVLISHKLIFDDDIKAIYKRSPTVIPSRYKNANFVKTLPVGVGLTADRREETSRAFVMKIRPRMSQHEGRDAETISQEESLKPEHVERLVIEMIFGKIEKDGEMEKDTLENALETMNLKYKSKGQLKKVLEGLKKKKVVIEENYLFLPGVKKVVEPEDIEEKVETREEIPEEAEKISIADMKRKVPLEEEKATVQVSTDFVELVSFPVRLTQKQAERIASSRRKKKVMGLFGSDELVRNARLFHEPIYRIKLDILVKENTFVSKTIFISAVSGEFMHFLHKHFVESKGVSFLWNANPLAIEIVQILGHQKKPLKWISEKIQQSEEKTKSALKELTGYKLDTEGKHRLVEFAETKKGLVYFVSKKADLPKDPFHHLLDSLDKAPFEKTEAVAVCEKRFEKKEVPELIQRLFPKALVKKIEEVYRPFYAVEIEKGKSVRKIRIDAYNGTVF